MDSCQVRKEDLANWCNTHLATHTDWTGTRVETKQEYASVQDFIDKLWAYLADSLPF